MKLDHMVILVSDSDACLPFYDSLLPMIGFTKQREHVFVNQDEIYLDFRVAAEPEHQYQRFGPGLNHLGFTAPSLADVVRVGEVMKAEGFEVPAIQEFDDGSALFLRDSDGMRVEIASYK